MGICILLKSGSDGIDPDELTATKGDILFNKLAGVAGNNEAVLGTMPNRGAVSQTLNCGNSYTIPSGYHDGSGKVIASSLLSQTSANAVASQILSGQTAWVNGSKITGSMANRGAISQSLGINGSYIIPAGYHNGSGKVTQSIATQGGSTTTPGLDNKTIVSANRYVNGNIIVTGSGNLTSGNIKKGVNIFGITGTFQGYVPSTTDLYLRGNNSSNFSNGGINLGSYGKSATATFEAGQISLNGSYSQKNATVSRVTTQNKINLLGFTAINVQCYNFEGAYFSIAIANATSGTESANSVASISFKDVTAGDNVFKLDISHIDVSAYITVQSGYAKSYVYRIWLT